MGSRTTRTVFQTDGPVLVGVVGIGVSCALMKRPLSADPDVSDIFDIGSFSEATGTITGGGVVAGSWNGDCSIYGYPYEVERRA